MNLTLADRSFFSNETNLRKRPRTSCLRFGPAHWQEWGRGVRWGEFRDYLYWYFPCTLAENFEADCFPSAMPWLVESSSYNRSKTCQHKFRLVWSGYVRERPASESNFENVNEPTNLLLITFWDGSIRKVLVRSRAISWAQDQTCKWSPTMTGESCEQLEPDPKDTGNPESETEISKLLQKLS